MYLDHFGLEQSPFSITPDPRFVFLSDRHREALAHLIYGISQGGGGGFVQLTGEVGTGKTTLSRLLLEQLPANTRVALVLNPRLDPVQLLESICEELRLDTSAARGNGKALVDLLNRCLLDAHARDERVVLILDEAQQLSVDALEQVRLLTNLETATHKLLQIVLLGQPELRTMLARADLRQLAQRITARYHLAPLDADETAAYVRHRLAVAGLARSPFTARALRALHRRSGGVPRLINVIAERALLAGYARDTTQLDARLVNEAADELLPPRTSAFGDRGRVIAMTAALVLGVAGILAWQVWQGGRAHRYAVASNERATAIEAATGATPPVTGAGAGAGAGAGDSDGGDSGNGNGNGHSDAPAARSLLAAAGTAATDAPSSSDLFADTRDDIPAVTSLLDRWQAPAALADRIGACPFDLGEGLHCVRSRGTLAQLAALGRPVLLLVPHGGDLRPVALLSLDAGQATISTDGGMRPVPRTTLERAWPGEYLAVTRLPGPVTTVAGPDLPAWARDALAGFESNRSLPPLSDEHARLQRLQQALGLRADGIAGPETWWALSAWLDGGPRLRDAGAVAAATNR